MQLSRVVIWTKNAICNAPYQRYTIKFTGMCNLVILHIHSHNSQSSHHYSVNLWIYCVHSVSYFWHHANFATSQQITILALKYKDRRVWIKLLHLVIWCPIRFISNIVFTEITKNFILNSSKQKFLWDMEWQYTAPWIIPFCHVVLALKLLCGARSHMQLMKY